MFRDSNPQELARQTFLVQDVWLRLKLRRVWLILFILMNGQDMVGSVASVASHARAGVVRGVGIAQAQGPQARQGQFQLSPPLGYILIWGILLPKLRDIQGNV